MTTLLFLASAALASSSYPAAVEGDQGMPCAPQCTLCHTTNAGGGGTVTSAFGVAMMDRGMAGGSQTNLVLAALASMGTDGVDSDGDGIVDVDELTNGDDPNGGAAFCDTLTPTYGCFNTSAGLSWSLGGVALAAFAARRRR